MRAQCDFILQARTNSRSKRSTKHYIKTKKKTLKVKKKKIFFYSGRLFVVLVTIYIGLRCNVYWETSRIFSPLPIVLTLLVRPKMVILTQVGETQDKLSTFFDLSDSKLEEVYINKPCVDCTWYVNDYYYIIFLRLHYMQVLACVLCG